MKRKVFDLIFGIGAACQCTMVLRKCLLQYHSYPFDWHSGASFSERIDILCHRFEHFLDFKDLQDTGDKISDRLGICSVVYNKRTHITFNHDFPGNMPLEKSYPIVLEKYRRRIDRLLNQIQNSNKILVVYQETVISSNPLKENGILFTAYQKLKEAFPQKEIHLLYISYDISMLDDKKQDEQLTPFIRKVTMNYKSRKKEAEWAVNEPLVKTVYKNIRLRKSQKKILKEQFLWWISYLIVFRAMRRRFLRKCHFYI